MVDVDNLTDAELRTKLLEFGFPVMPITGTTRKVMTKKLKLLLETKNKANSSDGRRSLGRYSSEEDSDTDVKSVKNQKNRRATMAAPVSSTTKTTRKVIVEPEVVSSSPRITSKTVTTRTSNLVKLAQDDFDTGSDSESDIVASSNKYESKDDNLFQDVEFNKRSSPIKSSLSSSYSRYSPKSPSDLSYTTGKNVSFSATSSPSRHTTYLPDTVGLSESLASNYAADRLNQIRSRLSLGSPNSYDKPSYSVASPEVKLTDRDTPFLSNFTRRLSALSASKKGDVDKSDFVKEHDSNGLYGKSYLSSFRANRGREPTYDYKTRQGSGGKNNLVSYAVLVVAATFFVILGVVYLGMVSDTSVVTSGFNSSTCDLDDPNNKRGVNCILEEHTQNAINLLNSIRPELHKRAVAHRCFDATLKPHMTETEIVTFCQTNYGIKDPVMIRNDLRNLEVLTFSNPKWGIRVAQTENNDGTVDEGNLAKNMEQVVFNLDKKITSLVILQPDLPYRCVVTNYIANAFYTVMMIAVIFVTLLALRQAFKLYTKYERQQKNEVNDLVEKILEILQSTSCDHPETSYVVINHVRDAILNVKERKAKQKLWKKAVKYINENESRVRTEVQTVHGESFDVWRWIGGANLSMTGPGKPDFKYRPGRRIVDVEYLLSQTLQFPHRPLFFCRSTDVTIKNEIREGFFSIYVFQCGRCRKEHSVCSEEPKTELLDVNLAFVAGILSLGLDLYQLNEVCSAVHIPRISGQDFERYKDEIRKIYDDSKSEGSSGFVSAPTSSKNSTVNELLDTALEEADLSLVHLDLDEKQKTFLQELAKDVSVIEQITKDQNNSEVWMLERKKRLTASNFGRIVKLLDKTNRANVVKDLLYSTFKGNIYTEYGQQNEHAAISLFEQITGRKVEKSGLVVHKSYPYLAASPDGIIVHENALIEVKCPYKARESSVEEACQKKEITFATFEEGKLKLKKEDKFYYQVQGQLHVTGAVICYFVVWTPKDIAFQVIEKDKDCWEWMFPKLKTFYFDHMLPEILSNT